MWDWKQPGLFENYDTITKEQAQKKTKKMRGRPAQTS
jgi:hypothetical protein